MGRPNLRPKTPEEVEASIADSEARKEKRVAVNRESKKKVFDGSKRQREIKELRDRNADVRLPIQLSWIYISEMDIRMTNLISNQIMVMYKNGSFETLPRGVSGNKIKEYLGFKFTKVTYWCALPHTANSRTKFPSDPDLLLVSKVATCNPNKMNTLTRVCIPSRERMKQLYAYGYTNTEIAEIMNQEFGDIEFDKYSSGRVQQIIQFNLEEFVEFRAVMQGKCVEQIQKQVKLMFEATKDVELVMVRVYVKKLQDAMESLDKLDLDEIDDETGAYKNTSRIFVLIEMAEKLQSKIAKIVGTDALREIEIYKAKVALKAESDNRIGHLMPAFGREVEDQKTTRFI